MNEQTAEVIAKVIQADLAGHDAIDQTSKIRYSGGRGAGFEIRLANGQTFRIQVEELDD